LKTNKFFTKGPKEKILEIQRIRMKLENVIIDKLGLKDKIENK
jgi:hypothetical protein